MEYERFFATEEGLAIAKSIAEQLGIEFDRDGTKANADQMHDLYFAAIVRVGQLSPSLARFTPGAFRIVNAFVPESDKDDGRVFFDEQLDMWLFTCTQLVTIMACKQLEAEEVRELVEAYSSNLDVPSNPYLHEPQRRQFLKFCIDHADCLEITTALTRAMVIFAICHEIGHIMLGHHERGVVPAASDEFQADQKAAELFIRIFAAGVSAHPIYVSPKLTGAPILLMLLFDTLNRHRRQRGRAVNTKSHPRPKDRAHVLESALGPILDEGRYVLDGFSHAIGEIARLAELPPGE